MKLVIGAPHGRSGKTTVTLGLFWRCAKRAGMCSPLRRGILLILAGSVWWREEIAVTWIFILWSMKTAASFCYQLW